MEEVTYQLGRGELVAAGWRRRVVRPRFAVMSLIAALGGVWLVAAGGPSAYIGVALLLYVILAPLMLYFALHRLVVHCPWLVAPTTLRFGDEGLRIAAQGHANEHPWSGFGRWSESSRHFVLYMGRSAVALTIPKRAFDERQRAAFVGYLARIAARPAA